MDDLKRLISFVTQHALFLPEERVLLGISGGRDSVLMAHLFNDAGFDFGIAHCNFNLRGEESKEDEQFVSKLATELGVPYFEITFDTIEYSQKHHISIQMAARDLRYQWLEKIRCDFGYRYIAIAQHQNDVIETMLLNLTRGTGIAGLHGILPKKGNIIRPLLFLSRDEIDQIVENKKLSYQEDSSNKSNKYARNKIRLEVIPVLKELNPSLEQTFESNRKRFEELEIVLKRYVDQLKAGLFEEIVTDEYEINLLELKKLDPADTLLYALFHPFGFKESVLKDFKNSWDGTPGKIFRSASYDINLDRDKVLLSKRKVNQPEYIYIYDTAISLKWGDEKFKSSIIEAEHFALRSDASLAQLDFELLKFPLRLRPWKDGDHFQPLGLKSKKKLSDFFIEQKVPLSRKHSLGILENGNGDILWIVGFRIDERYKITANTKKVFIFEQFN